MSGCAQTAAQRSNTAAGASAPNRHSVRQFGGTSRSADVEEKVMLLLIQGRTPKAIAQEMGYGYMGVHKIITRLRNRYGAVNDVQLGIAYVSRGG